MYDLLKFNPRIWITNFEAIVENLNASIENNGVNLVSCFLRKSDSKWFIRLTTKRNNIKWNDFREAFILHFETLFAKKVHHILDRFDSESISEFLLKKFELLKFMLPSLSAKDLNMMLVASCDLPTITRMQIHLHKDSETFIELIAVMNGEGDDDDTDQSDDSDQVQIGENPQNDEDE